MNYLSLIAKHRISIKINPAVVHLWVDCGRVNNPSATIKLKTVDNDVEAAIIKGVEQLIGGNNERQ